MLRMLEQVLEEEWPRQYQRRRGPCMHVGVNVSILHVLHDMPNREMKYSPPIIGLASESCRKQT